VILNRVKAVQLALTQCHAEASRVTPSFLGTQ
jgi:hypothetical protein